MQQAKPQQIQVQLGNNTTLSYSISHKYVSLTEQYRSMDIRARVEGYNNEEKKVVAAIIAALKQAPPDILAILDLIDIPENSKRGPLTGELCWFPEHLTFVINILGEIKEKYPTCPNIDKAKPVLTEIATQDMKIVQIALALCDPYNLSFVDKNDLGQAQRIMACDALAKFGADAKDSIPALEKILKSATTITYTNTIITKTLAELSHDGRKLVDALQQTVDKLKKN